MRLPRNPPRRSPATYALALALAYALIGGLWILLSDWLVAGFSEDPAAMQRFQTAKGLFFVVFTGLLFFVFSYWMATSLLKAHRLAEWSRRDPMTGLASRSQIIETVARLLRERPAVGAPCAVIMLDIARFRRINESFGIRAGDGALLQIAHRLREAAPATATLGRPGSDHFVAILPAPGEREEVRNFAERLIQVLTPPFQIGGRPIRLRVDAAVAVAPADGDDPQTLLQTASTAVFEAKRREQGGVAFSRGVGSSETRRTVSLESDLVAALEQKQFRLHFQPLVRLDSGRLQGCEALLRWEHPELGLIPPDRFIPLLEETGEILPVGEWVLREACSHMKAWRDRVPKDFQVGVNLSRRQLWDPRLLDILEAARRDTGVDPEQLTLEVTETLAMRDPTITRSVLEEIHARGYSLALDDFGSGYSCLAYLKEYPLDVVKIDRAFVAGIPENRKNLALIEIMMAMSEPFEVSMVAEGVEQASEARTLLSLGCQCAQGYWFGRPMPGRDFARLLEQGPVFTMNDIKATSELIRPA